MPKKKTEKHPVLSDSESFLAVEKEKKKFIKNGWNVYFLEEWKEKRKRKCKNSLHKKCKVGVRKDRTKPRFSLKIKDFRGLFLPCWNLNGTRFFKCLPNPHRTFSQFDLKYLRVFPDTNGHFTSEHTAREIEQKARKVIGMLKRGIKFTPTQPDVMAILEKLNYFLSLLYIQLRLPIHRHRFLESLTFPPEAPYPQTVLPEYSSQN